MEEDLIFGLSVEVEDEQAIRTFENFYKKFTSGLEKLRAESGGVIDTKEMTKRMAAFQVALAGLKMPNLNTKQLAQFATNLDSLNRTLSQPVGKAMDKHMASIIVNNRKFGDGIASNINNLSKLIGELNRVEQSLNRINTRQGFSISSGILNRFNTVGPSVGSAPITYANPGSLQKYRTNPNDKRTVQTGVFDTDHQMIVKRGNSWQIADKYTGASFDAQGLFNANSPDIVWNGKKFKSATEAHKFLTQRYEESKKLQEQYNKLANLKSAKPQLNPINYRYSTVDGFMASSRDRAKTQYAAEQEMDALIASMQPAVDSINAKKQAEIDSKKYQKFQKPKAVNLYRKFPVETWLSPKERRFENKILSQYAMDEDHAARWKRVEDLQKEVDLQKGLLKKEGQDSRAKANANSKSWTEMSKFISGVDKNLSNEKFRDEAHKARISKNDEQLQKLLPSGMSLPNILDGEEEYLKALEAVDSKLAQPERLAQLQKDMENSRKWKEQATKELKKIDGRKERKQKAETKEKHTQNVHEILRGISAAGKDTEQLGGLMSDTVNDLQDYIKNNPDLDPTKRRSIESTIDQLNKKRQNRNADLSKSDRQQARAKAKDQLETQATLLNAKLLRGEITPREFHSGLELIHAGNGIDLPYGQDISNFLSPKYMAGLDQKLARAKKAYEKDEEPEKPKKASKPAAIQTNERGKQVLHNLNRLKVQGTTDDEQMLAHYERISRESDIVLSGKDKQRVDLEKDKINARINAKKKSDLLSKSPEATAAQNTKSALDELERMRLRKDPLRDQLALRQRLLADQTNTLPGAVPKYAFDQKQIAKLEGEITDLKKKIKTDLEKQKKSVAEQASLLTPAQQKGIDNVKKLVKDLGLKAKAGEITPEEHSKQLKALTGLAAPQDTYLTPKMREQLLDKANNAAAGSSKTNKREAEKQRLEAIKDKAADLRNKELKGEITKQQHLDGLNKLSQEKMTKGMERTLANRAATLQHQINNPPKKGNPKHGGGEGAFNLQDAFNFLAFSQLSNATTHFTKSMIEAAGSLEQYKRRLDIVVKNPRKSQDYFDFLLNYEKITPYELPEVMQAGVAFASQEKTLKRVGETPKEALKLAGELGAINPNAGIIEAQRALSRIYAGDSNGLEILRSQFSITNEGLAEKGVKLTSAGVPLTTLVQKQRVADAVRQIAMELTGGVGAEGQSTTLQGKLSTLGSQVYKTFAKVMEPLVPGLTKLIDKLIGLLEIIEKLPEPIRKTIGALALFAQAVVSIATVGALGTWGGKALGFGLGGAGKAAAGAVGGAETAALVGGAESGVAQAATAGIVPTIFKALKNFIGTLFGNIWKGLNASQGALFTGLTTGAVVSSRTAAIGKTIIEAIKFFTLSIFNVVKGLATRALAGLATAAGGLAVLIGAVAVGGSLVAGKIAGDVYDNSGASSTDPLGLTQNTLYKMQDEQKASDRRMKRMGKYGESDDTFMARMNAVDPALWTKEQRERNIARINEIQKDLEFQYGQSKQLYGEEHKHSKDLNKKISETIDLRERMNGFLKYDIEVAQRREKDLQHNVKMGTANISDELDFYQKDANSIKKQLEMEAKKAPGDYLTPEEKKDYEAAKETLKKYAGKTDAQLGQGQREERQKALDAKADFEEKGTASQSANKEALMDKMHKSQETAKELADQLSSQVASARLDNELGVKDAAGRLTMRDKINAAKARKSMITPGTDPYGLQAGAIDNQTASLEREKFLSENKRRIESVRMLRGEEKARLREIAIEEKQALLAQTGYAEDKNTRMKAFAKEQADLERQLGKINKARNADDYYDTLKKLSASKMAEASFVKAMEGNANQINIIHEKARRDRLAIVQQTLTEIRNMEQQNIETIVTRDKEAAAARSEIYRSSLDRSTARKNTDISILDTEMGSANPQERFNKQQQILKTQRDIYTKERKNQRDQELRDNIRATKEEIADRKRASENAIYNIKLEMDKLGPGNSPEKNAKREQLRQSLYLEQNKLKNDPDRINLRAKEARKKINEDYTNEGRTLAAQQLETDAQSKRDLAQNTLSNQMAVMEDLKARLEYRAAKNPEEQSQFDKVKNVEEQFQAEKTLLELKLKSQTDKDLNPTMDDAQRAALEKANKIDILNLQRKYLDIYKEITSEVDKQTQMERQNRIEAIQAKLGESQKNQGLEGFSMGGTYSFEEMQQRDQLESEMFRLKAGFGMGKKKGQDHGNSMKKKGQDHGEKGAQFEGMFGNLKDDYIMNESNPLKNAFDYAELQKQGFEYKGGQINNKNASNFVPKLNAYVIVDLQKDGKTIKKIQKPMNADYTPKNESTPDGGA